MHAARLSADMMPAPGTSRRRATVPRTAALELPIAPNTEALADALIDVLAAVLIADWQEFPGVTVDSPRRINRE